MGHYVIGIDGGTESFRAAVFDEKGHALGFGVSPNTTSFLHPGWAEQSLKSWEFALVDSIKKALSASGVRAEEIEGIGIDGTSCTVVFLDKEGKPLRDAIMWMDIRATAEATEIGATGDAALDYVGHGNVSPEWFPCKVLWIKRNEPEIYSRANTIFEHTDWIAYFLTGERTVNINTISIRWFYNSHRGGFPYSLYSSIGLESVFDKIPKRIVKIGEVVGGLRAELAEATGLRAGTPVAGGGADAYIGVIGVNALTPGKLALITGSSQLQIGISEREIHASGIFGSFPDSILDGLDVIEAGQISTGSVLRWFTSNFLNAEITSTAKQRGMSEFDLLNERAENIPPGSEGLVVLEHWQGNRTPWTDPHSRGVIRGLTLIHGPAHIYRAIMEGIAYGTQVIIGRMEEVGVPVDEIIACGGATQSSLWMQIIADVTNKKVVIPVEQQAVSLGSAIAASVAAGMYPSLQNAAQAMVKVSKAYLPNEDRNRIYKEYVDQYVATYLHLRDDSHKLVKLAGG